jgi:hypothetical protein
VLSLGAVYSIVAGFYHWFYILYWLSISSKKNIFWK